MNTITLRKILVGINRLGDTTNSEKLDFLRKKAKEGTPEERDIIIGIAQPFREGLNQQLEDILQESEYLHTLDSYFNLSEETKTPEDEVTLDRELPQGPAENSEGYHTFNRVIKTRPDLAPNKWVLTKFIKNGDLEAGKRKNTLKRNSWKDYVEEMDSEGLVIFTYLLPRLIEKYCVSEDTIENRLKPIIKKRAETRVCPSDERILDKYLIKGGRDSKASDQELPQGQEKDSECCYDFSEVIMARPELAPNRRVLEILILSGRLEGGIEKSTLKITSWENYVKEMDNEGLVIFSHLLPRLREKYDAGRTIIKKKLEPVIKKYGEGKLSIMVCPSDGKKLDKYLSKIRRWRRRGEDNSLESELPQGQEKSSPLESQANSYSPTSHEIQYAQVQEDIQNGNYTSEAVDTWRRTTINTLKSKKGSEYDLMSRVIKNTGWNLITLTFATKGIHNMKEGLRESLLTYLKEMQKITT